MTKLHHIDGHDYVPAMAYLAIELDRDRYKAALEKIVLYKRGINASDETPHTCGMGLIALEALTPVASKSILRRLKIQREESPHNHGDPNSSCDMACMQEDD